MSAWKKKRFWTETGTEQSEQGFCVTLDGKAISTPGKSLLTVPSLPLAQAIAAEWAAQDGLIRPDQMPMTRAANSAVDKVRPQRQAVVDMLAEYGATDLLCYRAEGPESLVAQQNAHWEPHLEWAEAALGAPLTRVIGMIPHPQPEASLEALRVGMTDLDIYTLTSFHDFVTLPGSLVLGFGLLQKRIDAAEAIRLSELDAHWQEQFWGTDEEALDNRARKVATLHDAVRFLDLVRA